MSVRQDKSAAPPGAMPAMEIEAAAAGAHEVLGEGNSFAVAAPENPLKRNVVVSIKASLNDLCLQKARGTWAPSQEALRNIFQQRKFTSLDGAAEPMGGKSCLARPACHCPTVLHAGCRRTAPCVRRQTSSPWSSTT